MVDVVVVIIVLIVIHVVAVILVPVDTIPYNTQIESYKFVAKIGNQWWAPQQHCDDS